MPKKNISGFEIKYLWYKKSYIFKIMQRNKHGINSSKSQQEYKNYLSKNSVSSQSLKSLNSSIDASQSSLFNLGSTTLPNLKINPLMLSLLVLSMVSSVDGQKDQSQFKTDIDLKEDANSHPLQNPVPIPQIKEIFFGREIADSKKIMHEDRLHVVKAHGGEVAEVHDKILRDLGLVISEVTKFKKSSS